MTNGPTDPDRVSASRRDAWATLYDRYSVGVWLYVARMIGSDSDAVADAVQETFLAAAKNFDQFNPDKGTAWSWLAGIAHRQAALHWRRVSRERIDSTQLSDEQVPSRTSAHQALETVETVSAVRRILAELSSDSAAILTGKYCDGLSVAELVEQFGGTTEGVRSKLARARRDFRQRFERVERVDGEVLSRESLRELGTEHA